jgi:transcriptional regulator of arginine metabolism
MASKRERHTVLRRLIREQELHSQADVVRAFAKQGITVHLATVSRDLTDIGAVKLRTSAGGSVYRLAEDAVDGPNTAQLDDTLRRFVVGVAASGNLAVLRTPPACAQPVARAIDVAHVGGVIATVSGDDTVLVVAAEGHSGRELANEFALRAGRDPEGDAGNPPRTASLRSVP